MVNSLSLAVTRTTPVLPADTQIVKAYAANPFTFNVTLTGSETFAGITSVRMQIREYPYPAANSAALADITNSSPTGTTSSFAFSAAQFNQTTVHPSKTYWVILTALDPSRGMLVLWRARLILHPHYASETTADPPTVTTKLTLEEANTIYATIANLALKAPLASPALTGVPTAPTAAVATNTTQIATTAFVLANAGGISDGDKGNITVSASGATWTIDHNVVTNAKAAHMATATIKGRATAGTGDQEDLTAAQTKTLLSLENVTNTSDANKPVSTAQQTALNLKANLASPAFSGTLTTGGGLTTVSGDLTVFSQTNLNDTLVDGNLEWVTGSTFIYGAGVAAAHRTALGLGTLATQSGTFSGSGTLATGGFTLTVPATGTAALLGTANTFTEANTINNDALGTTTAARLSLTNTTAAAAGSQQVSPAWFQRGNGWKTTATAASQTVDFQSFVLPVQGTTAPTGTWKLQSAVNGAAMADVMSVSTAGQVIATNYALNGGDGSGLAFNTWATLIGQSFGVRIGSGSAYGLEVSATYASMPTGGALSWTDGTVTGSRQTFLTQKSAANIRQGAADAAAPVAQTSSVQNVVAGTVNTAGADRTYTGSQGTGTAKGGSLIAQTAPPGAAGSAQNALSIREYIYGGEKTLTESSETPILSIALGTSKYLGGHLIVTTHADDGTDFQATTEHFTFAAVNKAGAVTTRIQAAPSSSTTAASTGTLTTAWTIGATGTQVEIKNNAVSSLTQTTLKCSYQLIMNGDGTNVVTP